MANTSISRRLLDFFVLTDLTNLSYVVVLFCINNNNMATEQLSFEERRSSVTTHSQSSLTLSSTSIHSDAFGNPSPGERNEDKDKGKVNFNKVLSIFRKVDVGIKNSYNNSLKFYNGVAINWRAKKFAQLLAYH